MQLSNKRDSLNSKNDGENKPIQKVYLKVPYNAISHLVYVFLWERLMQLSNKRDSLNRKNEGENKPIQKVYLKVPYNAISHLVCVHVFKGDLCNFVTRETD